MAQQAEDKTTLSGRDLELIKTLISEVVKETKKPFVDEEVQAKIKAARQRMRDEQAEFNRSQEAFMDACPHRRDDNTSTIAWAENFHKAKGLWVKEGPCMRCGRNMQPGVKGYEEMLNVPVGKMGVIF